VQAADDAVALARRIADTPSLAYEGIMCYPTTKHVIPIILEAREKLQRAGLAPTVVSGGGTGAHSVAKEAGLTEHRSGTYAYNDMNCVRSGKATLEQCAMQVLVTVVSTASPGWTTVDGGSKTFTNDSLQADGHNGYVLEYPDVYLHHMNEEHGILKTDGSARTPGSSAVTTACGSANVPRGSAHDEYQTEEALEPCG